MFARFRCLSIACRFFNATRSSSRRTLVTLRSRQTIFPELATTASPAGCSLTVVHRQQRQPSRLCHKTGIRSPVLSLDKAGDQKWTTIFHYPYIKAVRMVIRVKVYQTVGALVISPAMVVAEHMDWLNTDFSHAAMTVTLSAAVVLLSMGYIAERVVGILYVNEDRSLLRVGRMDFWGNRRDHVFRTKDVAEFADIGEHWNSLYITLRRYSAPNDPLYLSLKHGGIVEDKLFREVFGNEF